MRIVFATDGSAYAKEAARLLGTVSFSRQPDLTLLTVTYDPEDTARHNLQPWAPKWRESQQQFVDQLHSELENEFSPRCASLTKKHLHGNVAHEIVQYASEIDAELIVLGAVGHSMIGRMILGSVSDNVATHAKCSVAIIRPAKDDAASDSSFRKITVAYDGSNAADEAIAEMSQLQWHSDGEIDVLTVMQEPDYLLAGGISTTAIVNEEQVFEAMQSNCDKATSRIAEILPNAQSKTVKGHHIGDTIVRTAAENGSDLIIVGDAGHNLVDELIVGSTTKYVLRHAPCSVWISRHHRQ